MELHNPPFDLIKCLITREVGLKILTEIFCLKYKFLYVMMYSAGSSVIIISKISIGSVLRTTYYIPGVPINCSSSSLLLEGPFVIPVHHIYQPFSFFLLFPFPEALHFFALLVEEVEQPLSLIDSAS